MQAAMFSPDKLSYKLAISLTLRQKLEEKNVSYTQVYTVLVCVFV